MDRLTYRDYLGQAFLFDHVRLSQIAEKLATYEEANEVPIVHCAECVYNDGANRMGMYIKNNIVCSYWGLDGLLNSDFCSKGKREDGVDDT